MLKSLIKKQLLEIFHAYVIDKKTGKRKSTIGIILYIGLFAILFGGLGFVFYKLGASLGNAIFGHGYNWLYFSLFGLLSIVLGVFGSVFNTYASLYLPKDNELLFSLPIPRRKLVLARLSGVYATSLMYSAWIWIPITIAYWVKMDESILGVIFPIISTFLLAAFVSVLSCILGFVVAIISTKTKGKSFITVFLSLFVIVLYYIVYFRIVNSFEDIMNNMQEISTSIKSWMHYIYWMGEGTIGNVVPMILFVVVTLALGALTIFVLTKTFSNKLIAQDSQVKKTVKEQNYKQKGYKIGLLKKELKHFSSVPTWMLNGGLGLLIMPASAIALIVKRIDIHGVLNALESANPEIVKPMAIYLFVLVGMFVAMGIITPAAVSMEGKSIWIVQTLPIDPWEVLHAKERMSAVLNFLPAMFTVIACGIVVRLDTISLALATLATIIFIWLSADFGLFLNLRHPNLSWSSVTIPIKQGLPVIISLFGGWLFAVVIGVGAFFACKITTPIVCLICLNALLIILLTLVHEWLKKRGAEIFATL